MGRSVSTSSSISLVLIFLLSVDLFGAILRANAVAQIIQVACDSSIVREFCYNVMENDLDAPWAVSKAQLELITIGMAERKYTNIARKMLTITFSETNPEYYKVYRHCLHHYLLVRPHFQNLVATLLVNGDLDLASQNAMLHVFVCMGDFTEFPNVPNPFAEDNSNMYYYFELIRDIYYAPLS
ncbi:hypothetical protein A4A49_55435 [Nicotiana attenuata]|uniref:Pectinesterase inhibitor domain-containing protein n=1 Tax=Nicotiana attenuata TaxID=49451 RepID=A0A314L220_NICAT|nr:hypothetical protein A4A49_55435 [Nicotiana attenuata]